MSFLLMYLFLKQKVSFDTANGHITIQRNMNTNPMTNGWYYIWLNENYNSEFLFRYQLERSNMVYKNVYKQYLKKTDCESIKDMATLRPILPKEKISPILSNNIIVQTSENAELRNTSAFIIYKLKNNLYHVETKSPNETAEILSRIPEVCNISDAKTSYTKKNYEKYGEFMNGAILHSIRNSDAIHLIYGINNLEKHNLKGMNQVISIIGNPIDWTHPFLSNNDNPIPFDTITSKHSKFVFYHPKYCYDGEFTNESIFQKAMKKERGTYIANMLTGKYKNPSNDDFKSIIPDAKIAYMGGLSMCNMLLFDIEKIINKIKEIGSYVLVSNWVSFVNNILINNLYNKFAAKNSDILHIYSYIKLPFIGSPATCSNILTVGSSINERIYHNTTIKIKTNSKYTFFGYQYRGTPQKDTLIFGDNHNKQIIKSKSVNLTQDPCIILLDKIDPDWLVSYYMYDVSKHIFILYNSSYQETYDTIFFEYLDKMSIIYCNDMTPSKNIGTSLTFIKENSNSFLYYDHYYYDGTSMKGILKPDILAPGIFYLNETYQFNNSHRYHDTDFSSAFVSGLAILLRQYFEEGKYLGAKIKPDSTLLRACIINSAQNFDREPKFSSGYGLVNISSLLPFENSNKFGLRISELFEMTSKKHYTAKIIVTNKEAPLKITMSYLDTEISEESLIPIHNDLDLVVVSKSGRVFYGNHKKNNIEEHLSTNEKIIIYPEELEIGKYKIHIFSNDNCDKAKVSVVVSGPFEHHDTITNPKYLPFFTSTKCVQQIKNGKCVNGIMQCDEKHNGNLCQTLIEEIKEGEHEVNFSEHQIKYFYIPKGKDNYGNLTIIPPPSRKIKGVLYMTVWKSNKNVFAFNQFDYPINLKTGASYEIDLDTNSPYNYIMIFHNSVQPLTYKISYKHNFKNDKIIVNSHHLSFPENFSKPLRWKLSFAQILPAIGIFAVCTIVSVVVLKSHPNSKAKETVYL